MRQKYIVGNWKMNQSVSSINAFFDSLKTDEVKCETWVSPQAIHISKVLDAGKDLKTPLKVGAQNICEFDNGAYTGENSAESLMDSGATFTLIGHSERRHVFGEDHDLLNRKIKHALKHGLTVIFCIGEQLEKRKNGMTEAVLKYQLEQGLKDFPSDEALKDKLIIAYEPVWAIGTGEVATPEQAQEAHHFIRKFITSDLDFQGDKVPLLYGGSVKPANAEGLLSQADIDGALVGGASLKGEDFSALADIATKLLK